MERTQETGLVGRRAKKNGPAFDVPDFTKESVRLSTTGKMPKGDEALAGDKPFIMHPDGFGWIWVPSGLKDGPLPTHYEPLESPVNPLYPEQHRSGGRT